jgi:P2 family phage contractile tail tube protein
MRGVLKQVMINEMQAGNKLTVEFMVAVDYYKLSKGDRTLVELDIENMKRLVGGVDQLENDRINLGL